MLYPAVTDPDLRDWLHWATESGKVPNSVKTVAEAACIADLSNYALLRPALLELRLRHLMPTRNSLEPSGEQVSPEGSDLTPELNGFIKRTLVPMLVASYVEEMKKEAKEDAGMGMAEAPLK